MGCFHVLCLDLAKISDDFPSYVQHYPMSKQRCFDELKLNVLIKCTLLKIEVKHRNDGYLNVPLVVTAQEM